MSDQTRERATIFVGGLDDQVTAETLHDTFIPFGEIADISLPKPELYVFLKNESSIFSAIVLDRF